MKALSRATRFPVLLLCLAALSFFGCRTLDRHHIADALMTASNTMREALHFPEGTVAGDPSVLRERKLPSGARYTGQIEDGRPHGHGTLQYRGWLYRGAFADGTLHGEGVLRSPAGFEFRGRWERGVAVSQQVAP